MNNTLLTVEQAQEALLSQLTPIAQTELCSLHVATWRILSQPITSTINVPQNNLSAMDGYAVNAQSTPINQPIKVTQRIAAGEISNTPLTNGEAARIFTGAMLPPNSDSVIMQEHVNIVDDCIIVKDSIQIGQHVRRASSDIHTGQILLNQGARLSPAAIGLCASIGLDQLPVYRPLTIALMVTGSELVEPGNPLAPGKTYNANLYLLESLLRSHGFTVVSLGIVADNLTETVARLTDAAAFDAIITTGGVSVGEEDHVRNAVSQLGSVDGWRVRMKPGKPFAFGHVLNTPYFGLPGNPVSAFTTFHLFVLPALRKLQGLPHITLEPEQVIADFSFHATDRREYLRARTFKQLGKTMAQIHPNQVSSALISTVWANGFIQIQEGEKISPGDSVPFIPFNDFRQ